MSLLATMHQRGGVVRTSELLDLGFSRRELRSGLDSDRLFAPLRGWLAISGAEPELVFAARHHVVLTCVTQARRLKLWVREPPGRLHVASHRNGKVRSDAPVVHWHDPWLIRPPYALTDPLENVLQCVAMCRPFESALVIWESALNSRRVDIAQLATLPLNRAARRLLETCTPFSDSGLESLAVERLRWLPLPVRQQIHVHGHRVDVLIGQRLVLQIDGATHTGAQRDADTRHDAELVQLGYTVLRVGYRQVLFEWETVQGLILSAIARNRHLA